MAWTAVIMGGSALIGGLVSANSTSKAASAAKDAASASQLNLDQIDAKTRAMARQNAIDSTTLEQQLTPEVPQLRSAANNAVLGGIGSSPAETAYQQALMQRLGQPVAGNVNTPLLSAAIAKAQSDLALGGNLDQDTRNAVMRSSLANAGSVGNNGGLGLGRDLSARDLGLTSLQLQNQRLQNASQLGQQQAGVGEFNVGTQFNNAANMVNQIQLLRAINSDQFGRGLSAAQYGQNIQKPIVGLDPSSVADIYGANASNRSAALSNQANIYGAQGNNLMGLSGNLAGLGLLSYGMNNNNGNNTSSSVPVSSSSLFYGGCWVAREVYGNKSNKWRLFRNWLFTKAPPEVLSGYLRFGPSIAAKLRGNPIALKAMRREMDNVIANHA